MNLHPDTTQQPEPAVSPRVLLVVEDDAELRAYIRQCLEVFPLRILEATDGVDALQQIRHRTGEVVLVISDIHMPRMDGRRLKATLQDDPRWQHTPVLLITGEATRSDDRPLLRKPFNAHKIRAVVQAMLDQ